MPPLNVSENGFQRCIRAKDREILLRDQRFDKRQTASDEVSVRDGIPFKINMFHRKGTVNPKVIKGRIEETRLDVIDGWPRCHNKQRFVSCLFVDSRHVYFSMFKKNIFDAA